MVKLDDRRTWIADATIVGVAHQSHSTSVPAVIRKADDPWK
jgi:hypothetical protein